MKLWPGCPRPIEATDAKALVATDLHLLYIAEHIQESVSVRQKELVVEVQVRVLKLATPSRWRRPYEVDHVREESNTHTLETDIRPCSQDP